jgi:hypothetical protein
MRIVLCVLRTILCLGVSAASAVGGPVTYRAVGDWAGANPSGPWSYMNAGGWGQALSIDTLYLNPDHGLPPFFTGPLPGLDSWSNGIGQPHWHGVVHNQTSTPYSWVTVVLPPDLLLLDPQDGATAVRFTSPQTGLYSVSGLFQTIDIYWLCARIRETANWRRLERFALLWDGWLQNSDPAPPI